MNYSGLLPGNNHVSCGWLIVFLKYSGISFPSYFGSSVGCDGDGQDEHVERYCC